MEPGGAPVISSAFLQTMEKTKRGEINVLVIFMHISTKISCPRSIETNTLTSRLPVSAKIFEGLPCTVVIQFHHR